MTTTLPLNLSVAVITTTSELYEIDGETFQSDPLTTYTDTHTYAAHVADAVADDYAPMAPAAWVASVILGAYCTDPSSSGPLNSHDWFSAEVYTHPYTGQIEEVSAHVSGDYTDALAREVGALVRSA